MDRHPPAVEDLAARYTIARYPVALIDRLRLADGRALTVRPVLPQDAPQLQAFVRGLSQTSRYLRFHHGLGELVPSLLREFTELDYARHLGLLAETFDGDGRQRVVADARLVRRADAPVADIAVVVDDRWQGAGLGSDLTGRLVRVARETGLARLEAEVLVGNARMIELLGRHGFQLALHDEDARLLRASLPLDAGRVRPA